jgi:hypothetical protein
MFFNFFNFCFRKNSGMAFGCPFAPAAFWHPRHRLRMRVKLPSIHFIFLKYEGQDFTFLTIDLLDFNIQFIFRFTFHKSLDIVLLIA